MGHRGKKNTNGVVPPIPVPPCGGPGCTLSLVIPQVAQMATEPSILTEGTHLHVTWGLVYIYDSLKGGPIVHTVTDSVGGAYSLCL